MPVLIGSKPESSFDDPIGLLGDCHRRVERFLGVLESVCSSAQGGQLTEEQREAWANALRYFRESAPRHTADEEESLFPRLRALGGEAARPVLAEIERLEADHRRAGPAHDEVDRLGQLWLTHGSLSDSDTARLSAFIYSLIGMYRAHIALEDGTIFPAAAKLLSDIERRSIGAEMAARRGLAR